MNELSAATAQLVRAFAQALRNDPEAVGAAMAETMATIEYQQFVGAMLGVAKLKWQVEEQRKGRIDELTQLAATMSAVARDAKKHKDVALAKAFNRFASRVSERAAALAGSETVEVRPAEGSPEQ